MEYLALFVMAALSHTCSARSWGDHHHYPTGNHHSFDYNTWCHSAGGWPGDKDSWEDSSSQESQMWNDDRWTRSPTTKMLTMITTKTQQDTSTISIRAGADSPFELLLCLRECPITPEYNPVCGTDDITYWNPGRLQCAISCGIDVGIKRQSICPTSTSDLLSTASTSPPNATPSPQAIATCMRSCPVTSEYNPICGTDNITYNNPSRLDCAKTCGKPVSQRLASRCPPPDQIDASSTSTSSSTTTTSRPNTSVSPNTDSRSSTQFTISPDILDAVFNGNKSVTTTENIPDYSLDERYEDQLDCIV
ncbi:uncharacterized protein LOC128672102 [Plodia interpunctella]|uniref:uncharacterized protein LOC128672102 n=1 Tax=Plodia interpunctella TaxID=58824 RepID=UPI002368E799|nr:uncharacterized protein LOC128672102 [Plodia interpunctella]